MSPHNWTTGPDDETPITPLVLAAANRGIHGNYQGSREDCMVQMADDLALLGGVIALLDTAEEPPDPTTAGYMREATT